MSVLGHMSVQEANDLGKITDFRFERVNTVVKNELDYPNKGKAEWDKWEPLYKQWKADWGTIQQNFASARMKTMALGLAGSQISDDYIPDQDDYDHILTYTAEGSGPLPTLTRKFEALIGHPIDLDTGRPIASTADPDIHVLQAADSGLKAAQAAAGAAGDALGQVAKSNIGLLAIGGLGLLVTGVVVAKVYL